MLLSALAIALIAFASKADAFTVPPSLEAQTLASGLQAPTAVAFAPDGRIFIAEKQGTVKVVLPGEAPRSRLLLDISSHTATYVDRGLLGIAVDSDFIHNHYLYLLYTFDSNPAMTASAKVNRLTRVTVGAGATISSGEKVLLGTSRLVSCPKPGPSTDCLPQDGYSHSIGTVRSAPDGSVWVGLGDGVTPGSLSPTIMRALDPNVMSGAILHVDRNGRGLRDHPFCPEVTDLARSCTKVFAKGFRNPFRFSLLADGTVSVGDVGYESFEEVDFLKAGGTYGWPCREGTHPTPGYSALAGCLSRPLSSLAEPVIDYPHAEMGGAVMSGPQLDSSWPVGQAAMEVIGDYAQGTLGLLDPANPSAGLTPLADGLDATVDLESAPDGGLAMVEAGFTAHGLEPGKVIELRPAGSDGQRPWPRPTASISDLSATFNPRAADADSQSLTYLWDFGDGTLSIEPSPTHVYAKAGVYLARVTVSDGSSSGSDLVPVAVGLAKPVVTITSPTAGTLAADGQLIGLSGSATVDGVPVPARSLTWTVLLNHGMHQHYVTGFAGRLGSFRTLSDHDVDSWYDIKLTANVEGRTASASVRLLPRSRTLTLQSNLPSVQFGWAGNSIAAGPRTTAVGLVAALAAPATALDSTHRLRRFSRWSDGSHSANRTFKMPDRDLVLKAIYS
jgi:glucose/arabinose dehydrogenase